MFDEGVVLLVFFFVGGFVDYYDMGFGVVIGKVEIVGVVMDFDWFECFLCGS